MSNARYIRGSVLLGALLAVCRLTPSLQAGQKSPNNIRHAFLVTGPQTYIVSENDRIVWRFERATRDGCIMPRGQILLVLAKGRKFGGGVVIVDRFNRRLFEYKGEQDEVNTAQFLKNNHILITEAGQKPCIKEITPKGKVAVRVNLKCQVKDTHLQTRMTRKLPNGNYLVPQLLDKVVREYTPSGEIRWEVKTPDMPFTAIRLPNGNTLIGCTRGNLVLEVDKKRKPVWRLTNDDLPGSPLNDVCGVQRLPNGNTVLTSYHAKGAEPRLIEVTREKKIVWSWTDTRRPGVHHFQILNTNGKPLRGRPLR